MYVEDLREHGCSSGIGMITIISILVECWIYWTVEKYVEEHTLFGVRFPFILSLCVCGWLLSAFKFQL